MPSQPVSRRRFLAASSAAIIGGLSGCVRYLPLDKGQSTGDGTSTIHVKPDGSFTNPGTEESPLGSINRAVNIADTGDIVYVHSGEYTEVVEAEVGGDPDNPVTLTGPKDAVLKPPGGKE